MNQTRAPATEEWFQTTGEQILRSFFARLQQYKKGLQFKGGMGVELNETESIVFKFIQKGTKDTNALMSRTGKTRRTVLQAVHKLEDAGLVEKVGTARFVTYKPKEAAQHGTDDGGRVLEVVGEETKQVQGEANGSGRP